MATYPDDPKPPRRPMGGATPNYGGRYQNKPPSRAEDPKARAEDDSNITDTDDSGALLTDEKLLKLCREASGISREYYNRHFIRPLARSYRAWRNEHQEGSKYLGPGFRGRSRLFVPKTRAAVRKNVATALSAMFSTEDVATVSAVIEDDPIQLATAQVKKELINYRLGRGNSPGSCPWFLIAGGGMEDAQITGVTISKQYWDYETVDYGTETVTIDSHDADTGEYLYSEDEERPQRRVVRDRPMVELIPFENVDFDPAAPWYDPVQLGAWFFVRYPMYVGEAKSMIRSAAKGGVDQGWLPEAQIDWTQGRVEDERSVTRRVREGGVDRFEPRRSGDWDLIWIVERCMRVTGIDYHFWTIGDHCMLSQPAHMEDVYPAFGGERPYKMGLSGVDTHRVVPMSPVDSWQPLQIELNDTVNLRQDALKRSISPLAMVRRGRKVDLVQVARRGQPEAVLQVDDMNDVKFEATPAPPGAAYTETSQINAVFDELAGVMSTSSVQSSRQMNETVGGMQIMQGSANATSEFDLRVWIETWAEPVLRQVSKLEDYYESDTTALAIAGSRAKVWQRYGVTPTLDDLVKNEVLLRINIGLGSSDPMQRLSKLKVAMDMLAPLMPMMVQQGITPNMESIIEEVMGHAGFKDGMRFFEFGQPIPTTPVPPTRTDPQFAAELEQQTEAAKSAAKTQQTVISSAARMQSERERNQTLENVANIKAHSELAKTVLGGHAGRMAQQDKLGHDAAQARIGRMHELLTTPPAPPPGVPGQPGAGGPTQEAAQPAQPPQPPQLPQQAQLPAPDGLSNSLIMQRLNDMSEKVNRTDPMLISVLVQLAQAMKQMNAPKQVIRDSMQRVIGVAPMSLPRTPPAIQLPPPHGG